eukprot:TRINITY_DN44567_c0_g1_i1.p1 TRINITY_DN44567_c0_g1~~TRINITY_DN44567_c0_g1_i1.p1  ORF type:complete len:169 (+),score=36.71 TRINITY_DN44567_c0_g1_i1:201-707(+)
MGKTKSVSKAPATTAPASVKKKIGKVKVKGKSEAANADKTNPLKPASAAVPGQNLAKLRRDAVAAAARKAAARGGDSVVYKNMVSVARMKPKMTGERMMTEIEEARAYAEKAAASFDGLGDAGGGRGDAGRGRRRKQRTSHKSRNVMAAFRAPSDAPVLPSFTTANTG